MKMSKAEKVLWGEGLFLRPQHFQVQDNYHEQRLNYTIRSTIPFSYGVQSVEVDESQLSLNVLSLAKVKVLWQDGEIYTAPASDLLPESILIDDLNLGDEMYVYLALPVLQPNKQNITHDQTGQPTRYHSYLSETHDLFTDAAPSDITLLRRQAELKLLDRNIDLNQSLDGFIYMLVAKIKRQNMGNFELDYKFIPPILHIQSNTILMNNLKRTLNIIKAKITTIQGNNRENDQKIIEFRSGDTVSFWLINTLNTAYSTLNHIFLNPQIHPERLFYELLRLTGSLLTFSTAYSVEDLPQYKHHHLQESFAQIDLILRELLDTIISNRYINIALKEIRPSYWLGSLETDKITRETRLYISVSSSMMQTNDLIKIVPLRFKVGTTVDVEERVIAALPAIPLRHLTQVPTAIPVRSGVSYFEVEPHDELYQRMLESESICIYVPAGFQDISIELIAITNG